VLGNGYGKIQANPRKIDEIKPNTWYYFRQVIKDKHVKLYWSNDQSFDESKVVLEGELPKLNPGAHTYVGFYGVENGPCFADLVFFTSNQDKTGECLTLEYKKSGFELTVDPKTGWLKRLVSLQPSPLEVLDAQNPFVLSITDVKSGKEIDIDRVIKLDDDIDGCVFTLIPSNPEWQNVLNATLKYSMQGDMLQCSAKVNVLKDRDGEQKIKFGFSLKPMEWNRHFYATVPENVFEAKKDGYNKNMRDELRLFSTADGQKKLFVGSQPPEDVQVKNDNDWANFMPSPLGAAERNERLLAFGCFDTGKPRLFSIESEGARGTFPVMVRFPKSLKAGQEFEFELAFQSFPKPQNNFTQVMSWYADHAWSSNPATANAVGRQYATIPPRALPSLLNGYGATSLMGKAGASLPVERAMVESGTAMTWWIGSAGLMEEFYPLDDKPFYNECQFLNTPAQLRAEIKRQSDLGISPIIYRRSWLIWENCREDRPPYKKWVMPLKGAFSSEQGPTDAEIETLTIEAPTLNPDVAKAVGYTKIHKVQSDMTNPEVRRWWVNQVMDELEYYKPAGHWWDMADGGQLGIVDAMKQVRAAAAEKYPWMRFVGNETMFSMSALYTDAFAVEGFEIGAKSEISFQAAKAWDRPFFNLIYTPYYQGQDFPLPKMNRQSDAVVVNEVTHFAVRYRLPTKLPVAADMPVISVRQSSWRDGPKIPLVLSKELVADGQWHTMVVALKDKLKGAGTETQVAIGASSDGGYVTIKAEKGYVVALFVDLPEAKDSDIRLEVDGWGFFANAPSEGSLRKPTPKANSMEYDGFDTPQFWPSLSPLISKDGSAIFQVQKGESAKSWLKSDFRGFYRGLARGLALGGWPGMGPAEPDMPILLPLFDFSRQGLPLKIVKEPLAAVSASAKVKVSIWSGITRAQLAAYNEAWNSVSVDILVDRELLRSKYGFAGSFIPLNMQIFEIECEQGIRPATGFKMEPVGDDKVRITGNLAAHELFLLQVR
jgi:hypothetical protein